jgi:hypothetical protein
VLTAEQPDGGLTLDAGDGDDLVQELALLGALGLPVPLSRDGGILPQARASRWPSSGGLVTVTSDVRAAAR